MFYLNSVDIIGRLGRDPDVRFLQSGGKVVSASVATSESWKNKTTDKWEEKTEWHAVSIFNDRAVAAAEKAKKGDWVFIRGRLQTRKYTANTGEERSITEIVVPKFDGRFGIVGDKRKAESDEPSSGTVSGSRPAAPRGRNPDFDDEIPF